MKTKPPKDDIFQKDYDKIRQIQPRPGSSPPKPPLPSRPKSRHVAESGKKHRPWLAPLMRQAAALFLALALGILTGAGWGYWHWGKEKPYEVDLKAIQAPAWVEQDFIRHNIFSRPDVTLTHVNNIVIHYLANPNTSAKNNRGYFDGLADQNPQEPGESRSSHFIVGLEGEILQCIPLNEVAYANAPRNFDTISIEVCHPDETGQFNPATYSSLVKLSAWLCQELELSPDSLIRHYDINGKDCPKYFVDHEDAWKQLKKDVKKAIKNTASHS